jgi:hypothetical protein
LRRIALKQRDDGVVVVILLLAASRHNADLIAAHGTDLRSTFPVDGRRALEMLGAGVQPEASALVLL